MKPHSRTHYFNELVRRKCGADLLRRLHKFSLT